VSSYGYIAPVDWRRLTTAAGGAPSGIDPHSRQLFERIGAAADHGCGLIALHGML